MQHRIHLSRIGVAGTLAALVMYIPAALAAEQSFDRTLSVNGSVTLHVSTGAGHIRVTPGSDNQVHITGHVKGNNNMGWFGGSSEDSVARVAQNPPIEQAGNIIRIGDDRAGKADAADRFRTTPAAFAATVREPARRRAASARGAAARPR